jgi:hypothetical protein
VPPRKPPPEDPPPIPTDAEILDAIAEYRRLSDEQHAAYDRYTEARVRLVAVLRAAGVLGLSSL